MRIGVCLIALNEANYLQRCMHSLDFATVVGLLDGGSSDATLEVAVGSLAPVNPECIFLQSTWPWTNDFGAQRQHALNLIMTGMDENYQLPDWWMRIDADEAYSPAYRCGIRQLLESLPEHVLAVRVRQTNLYPDIKHYVANIGGWETHPRIFRVGPQYQWFGAVHERLVMMTRNGLVDIPEEQIVGWNVDVFHYGWLDKARRHAREDLYCQIPGSGVAQRGDLAERDYHIRLVPMLPRGMTE